MIGYGGAAFGGKTDLDVGVAIIAALSMPGCKVGFFRRSYPELEGADGPIDRSRQLLAGSGLARYTGDKHRWTFFNGSIWQFGHMNQEKDKYDYQGHGYDILIFDEATHFPWSMIDYMLTRNRATTEGTFPFCLMTFNPGNIGHQAIKSVFVDGPKERVKEVQLPTGTRDRTIFFPAFVKDNVIGLERDPEYPARLRKRDPALAEALLKGNWDFFEGQFFKEWSYATHTEEAWQVPKHYPRWRAVDWGFVHPFDVGWFAKDPDTGRVIVYREVEQSGITDRQQARMLVDLTPADEAVSFTYADPSMWTTKSYKEMLVTTATEYQEEGVILTRADNDRLSGARKLRSLMAALPDGRPGLIIFRSCKPLIRTIPVLVSDPNRPEDVLKMEGDDPYDMLRYGLSNIREVVAGMSPLDRAKQPKPRRRLQGIRSL